MNCFYGRSLFESERKRWQYFGNNAFHPTVDKLALEDKTIINFRYKLPDKLLVHQINEIVTFSDLEGLKYVEIVTGGDHGGGRFRMGLKLLFRFTQKETISKMFEIANVSNSSDDIEIINKTVLNKIVKSFEKKSEGGRLLSSEKKHLSSPSLPTPGMLRVLLLMCIFMCMVI